MKAINRAVFLLLTACASNSEIKDPMIVKVSKFEQCYYESDLYQVRKPGQLKFGYDIGPSGKVTNTKILEANFKDANLQACVIQLAKQVKYNEGMQGNKTLTLNFSPVRK